MKQRYIEKIKKMLNLARRTTSSHEAAAALRQARNLMIKYNIPADTVESSINEASSHCSPSGAVIMPEYVVQLAEIVARAFGVSWYVNRHYTPHLKNYIVYYGPEQRPEIAAYAFDVLSRQLNKGRREFIAGLHRNIKPVNRTYRADVWCAAWVVGVYSKIKDFAVTDSDKTLMEFFINKRIKNETLKKHEFRKTKKISGAVVASASGWLSGMDATLNHSVSVVNNESTDAGGFDV
ncbi:DUF2786 domain-containing protein [Citrobacter braakii]|uniref:DUF2786 domain-containing protein n=1 Tax=Citrobacter braakii TaxID=57706 RepID=UPI0035233905